MNEKENSDSAVVAINGLDGTVLWSVPGTDQMVGSAVFTRINDDKIPDVVIGGRSAQLKAIDGSNGVQLWRFEIEHHGYDPYGLTRFNFFSPQVIKDQNNDGISDLLIANGGNISAYKADGTDRYPGVLTMISGSTGQLIVADTMPDGRETYMSPIVTDLERDGALEIIYGSGGETMGGSLYMTTLDQLIKGDISKSRVLSKKHGHGFIAPPVIEDLNDDGVKDIIANWHGGAMMAIDGSSFHVLWEKTIEGTELNTTPTPGDANGDGIADFFTVFSQGAWPSNTGAIQILVDGRSGVVLHQDTIGCTGFSSALSFDSDGNGTEEFLFSVNEYNCRGIYLGQTQFRLLVYDYHRDKTEEWFPPIQAKNIGSTPWLGDLDNDEKLELIFCLQANYNDIGSFYGLQLYRMDFNIMNSGTGWTEYLSISRKSIL